MSSWKGKRRVIKSIIARVHNEFNVSIAEVEGRDLWQGVCRNLTMEFHIIL